MKRHWHHHGTAFEYFQWKERRGIIGRIAHYIFPSPVAVGAAVALVTLTIELPGGW